jgi:hypothetical protein
MRNINILINDDHTVSFDNDYAGLNKENLQGNIVFNFKNFVDGEARAEIIIDNQDGYILLDKVGETYTMPIKSSLLTSDFIIMQLVIDQPQQGEEYPVWKSETFTLKVGYSINATSQIPDDYPSWIEVLEGLKSEVETAVEQAENVNIESEQLDDGVKVITTDKYGNETTTIVPQGPQGEPGVPGAVKYLKVNTLPTENIQTDVVYLVPSENPTQQNQYDEYMYIDNQWEMLGQKQIVVDLTDYVKFTDYASSSKAGVFLTASNYGTTISSGILVALNKNYTLYQSANNNMFIGKGTLENVITGKGLVSNTDYATKTKGGVIKVDNYYGLYMYNGTLIGQPIQYSTYVDTSQNVLICKGTLENVLNARIGDIQTLLDNLDTGSGV